MSLPLVILLEERKIALANAAMSLPPGEQFRFERLAGEHVGVQYVIDLIQSLEEKDD